MTSPLSLCVTAILGLFLAKVFQEIAPEFKPLLLLGIGVVFFGAFALTVAPVLKKMALLGEQSASPELFRLLYKGLGISMVVSVTASFCRDLGEERIGERLELCGKGALLYLSLPVLDKLLSFLGEMAS